MTELPAPFTVSEAKACSKGFVSPAAAPGTESRPGPNAVPSVSVAAGLTGFQLSSTAVALPEPAWKVAMFSPVPPPATTAATRGEAIPAAVDWIM